MRLLWLCNLAPGPVNAQLGGKGQGGLWVDHVLSDLRQHESLEIRILCPGREARQGQLGGSCSWRSFLNGRPEQVSPELQPMFEQELKTFRPQVIHVWGTEFGHTLAMMQAVNALGLEDRTVISIQGLCGVCARHYNEGIPPEILRRGTFRDTLRQDNLLQQQRTFALRGAHEAQALQLSRHVMGRTHWDRACTHQIAPEAVYHFCNETLRDCFYEGVWQYAACRKHRIFASSRMYPLKGFHYALEALVQVLKTYPDAVLAVPGADPAPRDLRGRIRQDGYSRYLQKLTEQYSLTGHIEYLGSLSQEEMKQQYLLANAFIVPSTIENSSNSLGEAMLLGVPVAAADVGGVTTMLEAGKEGIVYPSAEPYMLADGLERIFAMGEDAAQLGRAARAHALVTHDPERNLKSLLKVYTELAGKEETL